MFEISFSEILVITIVALVVIGPERLPRVARTLGHLLGRAQRYVNEVKQDIKREMDLEELQKLQSSMQEAARSVENSVRQEIDQLQADASFSSPSSSAPAHAPLPEEPTRPAATGKQEPGSGNPRDQ